jgi:hypothetical protein
VGSRKAQSEPQDVKSSFLVEPEKEPVASFRPTTKGNQCMYGKLGLSCEAETMNMLMRTGKYTTEGYIKKNDY